MKKITGVVMKNIKGQNTVQELTGKDIICGPNGIGKTTRLQALNIALLGYVPGQGKKSEETFKHSSSESMIVGLNTEDFTFTREFKKKVTRSKVGATKVSIQQNVNISPSRGETKIAEKEARIMSELGSFPVMLDFNEFLNLSDSKRREFIYNLAGFKSEEWTKEKVKKYMEDKLLTMELEVNNSEQFQIMSETIIEALKEYPEGYDISMGLQSMIDWTKVKLSYWKDEKIKSEGAAKKLDEYKNQLNETDRNLKTNKEELEKFQEELLKVEKQISEDTQKKKNIDARLAKIEQLKNSIKDEGAKECSINIEDVQQKIDSYKVKMKKIDNSEKIKAIESELIKLENELKPIVKDKDEVKGSGIELKAQIEANEKNLNIVKSVGGCCVLDKRIACNKDFSRFIKHTEGQIDTWKVQKQVLADTYKDLEEKEQALNRRRKQLEVNKKSLENEELEANRINNTITSEINSLENMLNQAKSFDTLKAERINSLKTDLERLQNQPVEPIAPLELLQKQADGIREQINALKTKIQEQEESRITLSNLKASMIDGKKADYYVITFKALDEALGAKGLQGELVKETLEPIQKDIQDNLAAMGINNEFYFSTESEGGKEIFQFGWKDKFGDRRNFDALSTGQQMMLLIAMLTTFIEKADPQTRILAIDNVENLDSKNFEKVTAGLNMISNKLDNIILSGVIDLYEKDEKGNKIPLKEYKGFQIWNLSSKEEGELSEKSA